MVCQVVFVNCVVFFRFMLIRWLMFGLCMVMFDSWCVVFIVVLLWLMNRNCIFLFIFLIMLVRWLMLVLFSGVFILFSRQNGVGFNWKMVNISVIVVIVFLLLDSSEMLDMCLFGGCVMMVIFVLSRFFLVSFRQVWLLLNRCGYRDWMLVLMWLKVFLKWSWVL